MASLALWSLLANASGGEILPSRVKLDLPYYKQDVAGMCGPTCIRIIFVFWGESRYDEYEIAEEILRRYPNEPRYVNSGILEDRRIDWRKYPGTGTRIMRDFLSGFAPTENKRIQALPRDRKQALAIEIEFFDNLKRHLANGVPVIVHQYWRGPRTRGHYRVVAGYDDQSQTVFLVDPRTGHIKQNYAEFLRLWNVDGPWLPYNSIAFNVGSNQQQSLLRINLNK